MSQDDRMQSRCGCGEHGPHEAKWECLFLFVLLCLFTGLRLTLKNEFKGQKMSEKESESNSQGLVDGDGWGWIQEQVA